jgi:hypothetical protein
MVLRPGFEHKFTSKYFSLHGQAWHACMLRYLAMQCIKMGSTLRVAPNPNKDKPSPRLVYRFGCQDHAVKDFLSFRQFIKRIYRSIH